MVLHLLQELDLGGIPLAGADYRTRTSQGDSALLLSTYACCTLKSSDPLLLDMLACRGSSVNVQNERGDSALSIAAQYGKTKLISVLLQYGES